MRETSRRKNTMTTNTTDMATSTYKTGEEERMSEHIVQAFSNNKHGWTPHVRHFLRGMPEQTFWMTQRAHGSVKCKVTEAKEPLTGNYAVVYDFENKTEFEKVVLRVVFSNDTNTYVVGVPSVSKMED